MCWWLPAMTYPTGFLTAVLQVSARMNGLSIDSLSYETPVQISGFVGVSTNDSMYFTN